MSGTRKTLNLTEKREAAIRAALDEHIQTLSDIGLVPHYSPAGALVATPDASDIGTSKTLAAALALAVVAHGADADIHSAADVITLTTAYASYPSAPADLTEVEAIANDLATQINAHVANATPHRCIQQGAWSATTGVRATMALTTTAATDQTTSNVLLNAIKNFLNQHTKAGISSIEIVSH